MTKEYYQKNKEKIKEHNKKYYNEHKKEIEEYKKKYRQEHKEKMKEYNKKWYQEHKEEVKEYQQEHREEKKESKKKWTQEHQGEIKEYNKEYQKEHKNERNKHLKHKRQTDIHFKIKTSVSCAIRNRLRKRLSSKNGKSTFTFLPYTIDKLKKHLENQFEPWMNWDNWGVGKGKWSIDHIKPDSSFNYKSVEDVEFQECWALENLRPMDTIENIKKSNKY